MFVVSYPLADTLNLRVVGTQVMETGEWECNFWLVQEGSGDFFMHRQLFPAAISPMLIEAIVLKYCGSLLMDKANYMHMRLFEFFMSDQVQAASVKEEKEREEEAKRNRNYQRWTRDENKQLLEYYYQKVPYNEIAAKLQRTEASVQKQVSVLLQKLL